MTNRGLMDALHNTGNKPRWHGNGFVQLKLNETQRLHAWGLLTQPSPENNARIHDHVWDMTSHVLMGWVGHRTFDLDYIGLGSHYVYEIDGHDFRKIGQATPSQTGEYQLATGSKYTFPAGHFHESFAENALTIITKAEPSLMRPRTLAPLAEKPYDAHGDDRLDERQMWWVIESALAFTDEWGRRQLERIVS